MSSLKLHEQKRIVVKIGSALLVDQNGLIRTEWLSSLAKDIAALKKQNIDVFLVSSGSISVGRTLLSFEKKRLSLEEKQAAAAVGQVALLESYARLFKKESIDIAQVLLTYEDTEDRRRHLNARETLSTLASLSVVPIINENDTVATEEIKFGDNDRLAARVASMMNADTLILLSDIDGLYTGNPFTDPQAKHIPVVTDLTPEIEAMAAPPVSQFSKGGMITKLMAARIALRGGCHMIIASGKELFPLSRIDQGAKSTWFKATAAPLSARKKWIAATLQTEGQLIIDAGAQKALSKGSSLLPEGISKVIGDFKRGSMLSLLNEEGQEIGKGLSSYNSEEMAIILTKDKKKEGKQSAKFEDHFGYHRKKEVIHRDNLVLSLS